MLMSMFISMMLLPDARCRDAHLRLMPRYFMITSFVAADDIFDDDAMPRDDVMTMRFTSEVCFDALTLFDDYYFDDVAPCVDAR